MGPLGKQGGHNWRCGVQVGVPTGEAEVLMSSEAVRGRELSTEAPAAAAAEAAAVVGAAAAEAYLEASGGQAGMGFGHNPACSIVT